MLKNNVKINFIYQMVYRVLTIITPIVTSPYLSRVLGVESLGKYSASLAFVNYFSLCAMLGIEKYGNRTIARVQNNFESVSKTFWSIYTIQIVSSILSIIIYITFLNCFISSSDLLLYIFQGLWIISSLLDINWLFFGLEQFKVTVTRNIIVKILSIIAIFLFVKSPSDLNIYVLVISGSMVVSQLILWINLHKYVTFTKPRFFDCKIHFIPILLLFIPVVANTLFHIMDKTMLNIISDDINSGYYYQADKLANIPLGVITAMSTVMLPRVANTIVESGNKKVNSLLIKSFEVTAILSCSISFGIGAISDDFVPLFFGDGYEPCIILVKWFVPVLIVKALSDFIRSQYLIPKGHDKLYLVAICVGAASNIIFNLCLIVNFGALGAVLATLISELLVLIIQIGGTWKELPFIKFLIILLPYISIAIIMYFIIAFVENILLTNNLVKVVCKIGIGILVYGLLSIVYWKINPKSIFSARCKMKLKQ